MELWMGGERVCCLVCTSTRTPGMVKRNEGAAGWRRRRTCLLADGAEEGHVCRRLPKRFLAARQTLVK